MHPNQANKLVAGNCEDTIQYNTKKTLLSRTGKFFSSVRHTKYSSRKV